MELTPLGQNKVSQEEALPATQRTLESEYMSRVGIISQMLGNFWVPNSPYESSGISLTVSTPPQPSAPRGAATVAGYFPG